MTAAALAFPRPTRFTVVNSGSALFWGAPGGPMDGGNPEPKRRRKVTGHADGEAMRARILKDLRRRREAGEPSPSHAELAALLGVSTPTVLYHLRRLRSRGMVTWSEGLPRTLRLID